MNISVVFFFASQFLHQHTIFSSLLSRCMSMCRAIVHVFTTSQIVSMYFFFLLMFCCAVLNYATDDFVIYEYICCIYMRKIFLLQLWILEAVVFNMKRIKMTSWYLSHRNYIATILVLVFLVSSETHLMRIT